MMQLHETTELMNSSNYEDRFIAEYFQLKIRTEKLEDMLKKYAANTLSFTPKCSYALLHRQWMSMKLYLAHLEERAEVENIKL